jgi:hypothetical protein
MVLQTNSIARAIGAAKFFAAHLGSECTAIRCCLVNRLFAAEEGRLEELTKTLDQNVTVIDPREAEAALAGLPMLVAVRPPSIRQQDGVG